MKVINLFAGPGTGKSTTAAALFAELKYRNVNAELIQEAAKDAAWEGRSGKFFAAQQYILGEQSWRQWRLRDDVDIAVTDSPLPMGLVYMPADFPAQSLREMVMEDFRSYDNFNVRLVRGERPYNNKGRLQSEAEARVLDAQILSMMQKNNIPHITVPFGRTAPQRIIEAMRDAEFFYADPEWRTA